MGLGWSFPVSFAHLWSSPEPRAHRSVLNSVLTPGTGLKVVPIVNVSLVGLILTLVCSAAAWPDSNVVPHLFAMGVIAVLLLVTFNWFARELAAAKKSA